MQKSEAFTQAHSDRLSDGAKLRRLADGLAATSLPGNRIIFEEMAGRRMPNVRQQGRTNPLVPRFVFTPLRE